MTLRPSFFWCTHHNLVHRFENYAFADGRAHHVQTLEGCTMVGPYFTHNEAVEWGVANGTPAAARTEDPT